MWPKFWKATLISVVAYVVAVLVGLWVGLRFVFVVPALQLVWTALCVVRIVELRGAVRNRAEVLVSDLQDYGFYVGSLVSSGVLLLALVAASQLVTN